MLDNSTLQLTSKTTGAKLKALSKSNLMLWDSKLTKKIWSNCFLK